MLNYIISVQEKKETAIFAYGFGIRLIPSNTIDNSV